MNPAYMLCDFCKDDQSLTTQSENLLFSIQVIWWKTRSLLDGKRHHPEKHFLTFIGDRNHGMIPGLEPFSEFHLTVLAFNGKGDGPESSPIMFHTPEGGNNMKKIGAENTK